jgi:hypothetical protein
VAGSNIKANPVNEANRDYYSACVSINQYLWRRKKIICVAQSLKAGLSRLAWLEEEKASSGWLRIK